MKLKKYVFIGASGILKEGFKNSKSGWFGQGVYMTECSSRANVYTICNTNDSEQNKTYKRYAYIFVNEVLQSEKLQTFEYDYFKVRDNSTKHEDKFRKHVQMLPRNKKRPQATKNDYKEDLHGRRYRNIPVYNENDEYVADESVTVPRYLITFQK